MADGCIRAAQNTDDDWRLWPYENLQSAYRRSPGKGHQRPDGADSAVSLAAVAELSHAVHRTLRAISVAVDHEEVGILNDAKCLGVRRFFDRWRHGPDLDQRG